MALDRLSQITNSGVSTTISFRAAGINVSGIVTASSFVGDGSGLTGVVGSGSGVIIKDDNATVGTASTINFGSNLSVSAISSGIVTVTGTDTNTTYTQAAVASGSNVNIRLSGSDSTTDDILLTAGSNVTFSSVTAAGFTINSSGSGGGSSSQFGETSAGIHTLSNVGIGTTNPTSKLTITGNALVTGVVTATSFSGSGSGLTNLPSGQLTGALPALDGSALTGVIGSGSGVVIKDSGSLVGTAATIDFGDNLTVSAISAGIVTVTGSAGGGSSQFVTTAAGIHTLSNVGIGTTNPTSKLTVKGNTSLETLNVSDVSTFQGTVTLQSVLQLPSNTEHCVGDGQQLRFITYGSGAPYYPNTSHVRNASGQALYLGGGSVRITDDTGLTTRAVFTSTGLDVIGLISTTTLNVGTSGTVITTTNGGLVGIGTTNPTSKLSVTGDANITGVVTATTFVGALTGNASSATIATYTSEWILGANGSSDYTFTGPGLIGAENDPTLYLIRGQQYKFTNTMGAHPFRIQSTVNGSTGTQYNDGITNNDVSNGTLTWNVQFDTPNILYYQCTAHGGMGGKIYILNSEDNVSAGTTSAPSISPTGDSNTGIFFPSADTIAASTGGTSRITIDSSGNITVTNNLIIPLGTSLLPSLAFLSDPNTGIYSPGADQLAVATNGTQKLIILSDGKTGIGASSPIFLTDILSGTPNTGANVNNPSQLSVTGPNKSLTAGGATVFVNSNSDFAIDTGGSIALSGRNTTSSTNSVVWGVVKGAKENATSTNTAGYLAFASQNHNTGALVEAMRIDSQQRVGIGISSVSAGVKLQVADGTASKAQFNVTGYGGLVLGQNADFSSEIDQTSSGANFFIKHGGTAAITVDTSRRVGIGVTSPSVLTHLSTSTDTQLRVESTSASSANEAAVQLIRGSNQSAIKNKAGGLEFFVQGLTNEVARLDSSGRMLVGTTTARDKLFNGTTSINIPQFQSEKAGDGLVNRLLVTGNNGTVPANSASELILARSYGTTLNSYTAVTSVDSHLGAISFQGADGTEFVEAASIQCFTDAACGANDMPGRLVFSTTADGGSSPTERMRITNAGFLKASNTGSYQGTTGTYHEFRTDVDDQCLYLQGTNASWSSHLILGRATRAANSSYKFALFQSDNGVDTEFNLRGDGNAYADGSWNGGGADYAEYFEWSDNNPGAQDRRGISVVLDGDKIREAVAGEDPIGVISGNPSVAGDSAWNKWNGKYLRDEFGTYIQEDYEVEDEDGNTVVQQRRKLNPAYDPEAEYIPREQRPEWDCVGLMGKLRIRKGQVTGSRWIKMRDISDSVEEWLVR